MTNKHVMNECHEIHDKFWMRKGVPKRGRSGFQKTFTIQQK